MEGHAEVVFDRTSSLELEPMSISQYINDSLGVPGCDCEVIHI